MRTVAGLSAGGARTLTVLVGGTAAAAQRAEPVFRSFARHVVHLGGTGSGQLAKLFNSTLLMMNQASIADILDIAAQTGMDPVRLVDALRLDSADLRWVVGNMPGLACWPERSPPHRSCPASGPPRKPAQPRRSGNDRYRSGNLKKTKAGIPNDGVVPAPIRPAARAGRRLPGDPGEGGLRARLPRRVLRLFCHMVTASAAGWMSARPIARLILSEARRNAARSSAVSSPAVSSSR